MLGRNALAWIVVGLTARLALAADIPSWRAQEIDPAIGKVCYAVVTTDVDGDSKPDIVAVANDTVVWYQNPTWQKRDILRNATEPDNVCLQPHDVDGDGRIDFALGSAWRPTDTKTGGNLAIVTRTGAPEGTWRLVPITSEPTLHRVRWGDLDGDGRAELVVAPLQGRGTKGPTWVDWREGPGVRIMSWTIPARPFDEPWISRVITDTFHMVHNIQVADARALTPAVPFKPALLVASGEGVFLVDPRPNPMSPPVLVGDSYLAAGGAAFVDPSVSEAKIGHLRDGSAFVGTIHPWHGSFFQIYHGDNGPLIGELIRHRIAEGIAWGHAVWCADLDGDGDDEVVVGQRDPNSNASPDRRGPGVMIFDPKPGSNPIAFDRSWVDQGGVAVEDLVVMDLNADGRPDIVAGGRATHNVKIYWNEPRPQP